MISVTQKGFFKTPRVPQGLLNATLYFQWTTDVLSELVGYTCIDNVDDVRVLSRTMNELLAKVAKVLSLLRNRRLYVAANKLVVLFLSVKGCGKLYSGA